jgi:hypothetical protein
VPGISLGNFTLTGIVNPGGILYLLEDTLLIAFVTSRANNKLFRLRFLQGPDSVPLVEDMGTLGNAFKGPESIAVETADSGNKVLVVSSILPLIPPNNATDTTTLTRLSFGNSFLNTPTVTQLSVWKNRVQLPRGLTIVPRGDTLFYLQGDFGLNAIQRAWRLKNQTQFTELSSIPASGNMYDLEVLSLCDTAYLVLSGSQQSALRAWRLSGSLAAPAQPLIADNAISADRHSAIRSVLYNQNWYLLTNLDVGVLLVSRVELRGDSIRFPDVNRSATITNGQTNTSDFISVKGKWYACMGNFFVNTAHLYRYEAPCGHPVPFQQGADTAVFQGYDSAGLYKVEAFYEGYKAVQAPITVADKPRNTLHVSGNCLADTLRAVVIPQQPILTYRWSVDGQVLGTEPKFSYFLADSSAKSLLLVTGNTCGTDTLPATVSVKQKPVLQLAAPDSVCAFSLFPVSALVQVFNGLPSYRWRLGTLDSSMLASDTFSIPLIGVTTLALAVRDSIGCTTSSQKPVVSLDAPQVAYTVVSPCVGDSVLLLNTSTGTGSLSAQWVVQDSTLQSGTFDFGFRATDTGLVRVALSVANTTGCTNSIDGFVRVFAKPKAGFLTDDFCFGQNGTATDTSLAVDAPITQRWWQLFDSTGSLVQASNAATPFFTVSGQGRFTLKLAVATLQGCSDSSTRQLTVFPLPGLAVFSDTVCRGDTTHFRFQSVVAPGDSILTTIWQWPSIGQSSSLPAPALRLNSGLGYSLQVSTAKGCLATALDTALVHPSPVTGFDILKSCVSEPLVTRTLAFQGGDSLVSWQWRNGTNDTLSFERIPPFVFSASGSNQLFLSGSNVFGCTDSSSVSFVVHPKPESSFALEDTLPIVPALLQIQNNSSGAQKYFWQLFPNFPSDTMQQPTFIVSQPGSYTLRLRVESAFNCSDSSSLLFRAIEPMPLATVTELLSNSTFDSPVLSTLVRNDGNVPIQQLVLRYSRNGRLLLERTYAVAIALGETFTITEPSVHLGFPQQVCAEVVAVNALPMIASTSRCLTVDGRLSILGGITSGSTPMLWVFSPSKSTAVIRITSMAGAREFVGTIELTQGLHLYPIAGFEAAAAWYVAVLTADSGTTTAKVAWGP